MARPIDREFSPNEWLWRSVEPKGFYTGTNDVKPNALPSNGKADVSVGREKYAHNINNIPRRPDQIETMKISAAAAHSTVYMTHEFRLRDCPLDAPPAINQTEGNCHAAIDLLIVPGNQFNIVEFNEARRLLAKKFKRV